MDKSSPSRQKLDQDPRLFMWFMTLVVVIMYVTTLINNHTRHSPMWMVTFTILVAIHTLLHWMLIRFVDRPRWVLAYVIVQGGLALIISWMSNEVGMVFALYMALIGEIIGLLRLTHQGILAIVFFLSFSSINLALLYGWGSAFWWVLVMVPMVIWVGIYVLLYLRQLEAREKAQMLLEELEIANAQLRDYSTRVEDLTIANERQRMARELHDTLSQGLAGLILQLEAADAYLGSSRPEKARAIVQQTMEHARATLADARRAIDDLRQTDSGDLEDALRLEVSRFENATGIPCTFHAQLTRPAPDPIKETAIRAVAEALTNIARHAKASTASVSFSSTEKEIVIKVKDDGKGFDPLKIPAGHYGILGIRERVRLLGGEIEIESSPEKGTILSVQIPIII
jgi:NarL family two-component system sensor histidine kinase YdfH